MIEHNQSVSNEFSDHNWQRLVEAGPQIALAVAASSGSGKQSVAELGRVSSAGGRNG